MAPSSKATFLSKHTRAVYIMQYSFTRVVAFMVCGLLASGSTHAQDVLMAKGNAQITLSASPINYYNTWFKRGMGTVDHELNRFDYSLKFSKPLSLTAEYAVSSYTTVGINANYFTYDLSETREDDLGVQTATTKGKHIDLHARIVRYFYATPGSALYLLGEIGMKTRSLQRGGDKDAVAYINTFPETTKDSYSSLSYDYGIGFRARVIKQVGLSAEFTMLSILGRFGVFYIIQPAGRRSKDQIGW
jgi:hypothetical protein